MPSLCPYFGRCGGCSLQGVPPEEQLAGKKERVASALRLAGFSPVSLDVFSGRQFHYRTRMDFVFSASGLCLRERGRWNSLVPVRECLIANEGVNALLRELWRFHPAARRFAFDIERQEGAIKYAVVRAAGNTSDSCVTFVLNRAFPEMDSCMSAIRDFARWSSARNVLAAFVPAKSDVSVSDDFVVVRGRDFLVEELLGERIAYHSQGFFQNNPFMTEKIGLFLRESLSSPGLLDLYGGVGTFGVLAGSGKKVVVAELDAKSVALAERNLAGRGTALRLNSRDLSAGLLRSSFDSPFDAVVDPPRQGLHRAAAEALVSAGAERVAFVSCNPSSVPASLSFFSGLYFLERAAVFDMFPQTEHVEAVFVLSRRG